MVLANRVDVGGRRGCRRCNHWVQLGKMVRGSEVTAKCTTGRESKTYVWKGKKEKGRKVK